MSDDIRPDIAAAKAAMATKVGGGREIKRLEDHLHTDETVKRMVVGRYAGKNGIITLTDRRALFIAEGRLGKATEDIPLDRITSVSWKSGMLLGSIEVHASGAKVEIENVNKSDDKAMVEDLRAAAHTAHNKPTEATPAPATDHAAALVKLAQLRDAGILTVDEFEAKKADILGRI